MCTLITACALMKFTYVVCSYLSIVCHTLPPPGAEVGEVRGMTPEYDLRGGANVMHLSSCHTDNSSCYLRMLLTRRLKPLNSSRGFVNVGLSRVGSVRD